MVLLARREMLVAISAEQPFGLLVSLALASCLNGGDDCVVAAAMDS
jgi:hypothetical protein